MSGGPTWAPPAKAKAFTNAASSKGLLGGLDATDASDESLTMGQTADFFIATDSELSKVLPGWNLPKPPLVTPNRRSAVNPFTGAPMDIESYVDPSGGPADADAVEAPILREAGGVLEWKWITDLDLAALVEIAADVSEGEARKITASEGLYGPATATGSVFRVPAEVLALLQDGASDDLASRLAEADEGLFDRSAEDFGELLSELQKLAVAARSSGRTMYLHVGGA